MTKETTRRPRILNAPWSGMTLPGLAQGSATLRPDAPAVIEPDNTEALIGRKARLLTCKALVSELDLLAQKLRSLGIVAGDVVLVVLPNCAEAHVALLALQKLGAIPAPAPVFETAEALAAMASLGGASAILTTGRFAGLPLAATCREAAVGAIDVRFVAAFGADLPEGVISLDAWDSVEFLSATPFPRIDGPDDALMTFDLVRGQLRALVRSHEQLVAEAAGAAALGRIGSGTRLLATLPPASAAGAVFCLSLPLLTGAWVELNLLFDSAGFAAQLGSGDKTTVILPAAAEAAYRHFRGSRAIKAENLVLIHRMGAGGTAPILHAFGDNPRVVDVIAFGEAGCLTCARPVKGATFSLPTVAAFAVAGVLSPPAKGLMLSRDASGYLTLSGALAPRDAVGDDTSLSTDILVEAEGSRGFLLAASSGERITAA